ncbi:MAG: hypothetical protein Q9186_001880 [Xanthomendoza sp. 1 TL-2023]
MSSNVAQLLTLFKVRVFPQIDIRTQTLDTLGLSKSERTHRSTIQGISVAAYNLGCFIGACACLKIGDILGRRKTIFVGSSIMIVGAALQCSAYSLGHFIVGRIITGRGQLVMVEGALITGGICFSYWLDFGFSFLDPNSIAWRFPIGFQIFFALVILLFVLELPESPRWLVLKGKEGEALNVLGALSDKPSDDPYIWGEFQAIKDTVIENQKAGGIKDLFTMGPDRHLHRTMLAYINQMFQQISGINLITYYAATIYQNEIKLDPFTSRILAAANGTGKYPLRISSKCALVAYTDSRIMDSLGGKGPGIVAALFLFLFNTFFAIGWLGMTWLYPAEIVPLRIRATANAFSTSANWIFNFMVVMITPVAFASIGYQTYIIFAVINAFIFPCVWFFYPETAYRSLEEMDSIFRKCHSVFTVVRIAKEEPQRYGKSGELLIDYEDTEEHRQRQASVVSATNNDVGKVRGEHVDDLHHPNPDSSAENGTENER